ncbi:hypothetical protein PDJAM_G00087240 [Pangasius djambal]|uniref:Uncharacterized protein n=1 Tax=Pangasius djambal TaxID=1691987 RepID=A0ACC5Z4U9_9TELE|nr:hypothetical protein [Pangasius djambal]
MKTHIVIEGGRNSAEGSSVSIFEVNISDKYCIEHFITVDANSQGNGDKAVLLGPDVEVQDWSCLRLIYQITGAGWLQVLTRSEGESFDHTLWSASSPSESWLITTVDLQNSTEPYKVRDVRRSAGNHLHSGPATVLD